MYKIRDMRKFIILGLVLILAFVFSLLFFIDFKNDTLTGSNQELGWPATDMRCYKKLREGNPNSTSTAPCQYSLPSELKGLTTDVVSYWTSIWEEDSPIGWGICSASDVQPPRPLPVDYPRVPRITLGYDLPSEVGGPYQSVANEIIADVEQGFLRYMGSLGLPLEHEEGTRIYKYGQYDVVVTGAAGTSRCMGMLSPCTSFNSFSVTIYLCKQKTLPVSEF